ncbi:PP2C family protein-serine/threonine phosphatase [Desulfobacter vibrioformis]|uniref:PP2C family protein-serine/threonine phosphatase n=1 Tax=Desulfobacter vibrioformis TaxID=34031 RepID=UPI0006898A45|nr:fused response regulator/phosphatase [Desulfobacter vibrioformis]
MSETILVVDDMVDNRNLLRVILKKQGYEIVESADGEAAIATCMQTLPDLVLLDIVMPKKNGYEVCDELKDNETTRDIPVIFLSARNEAADKIRGLELGAVDYITKPFDKGEVIARVKTQLQIYKLTRSLVAANRQLTENQKKIEEDLKAAGHIQKSLIPSDAPKTRNFNFAWCFVPCEHIGGDIFNFHHLDENHLSVYILDVSGHGVPSAMVTVSVHQRLQPGIGGLTKQITDTPPYYTIVPPSKVLDQLDHEYPMERFDKHFTMAYLILNTQTGAIRYTSAAHPMPVLVRASGEIELLDMGGSIVGLGGIIPFEEGEITMHKGDRLYLYTDGIVEFFNEAGEAYGEDRFYSNLMKYNGEALEQTCRQMVESLNHFGGERKAQDDITLVAIECCQTV